MPVHDCRYIQTHTHTHTYTHVHIQYTSPVLSCKRFAPSCMEPNVRGALNIFHSEQPWSSEGSESSWVFWMKLVKICVNRVGFHFPGNRGMGCLLFLALHVSRVWTFLLTHVSLFSRYLLDTISRKCWFDDWRTGVFRNGFYRPVAARLYFGYNFVWKSGTG